MNSYLSASANACASPTRCSAHRCSSSCGLNSSSRSSSGYDTSIGTSLSITRVADFEEDFKQADAGLSWVEEDSQPQQASASSTDRVISQSRPCCGAVDSCRGADDDAGSETERPALCNYGQAATSGLQRQTSLELELSRQQLQHEERHRRALFGADILRDALFEAPAAHTHTQPAHSHTSFPADSGSWRSAAPPPAAPLPRRPACTPCGAVGYPAAPHPTDAAAAACFYGEPYQPPRPAAPPPRPQAFALRRYVPNPRPRPAAAAQPHSPPAVLLPLSFESSLPTSPLAIAAVSAGPSPAGEEPPVGREQVLCGGASVACAPGQQQGLGQRPAAGPAAAGGARNPWDNKTLCAVKQYYDTVREKRSRRPPGQPAQPQRIVVGFELN